MLVRTSASCNRVSQKGLEPITNEELKQIEEQKLSPYNIQPFIEKSKKSISIEVSPLNTPPDAGTEPLAVKEDRGDKADMEKDTEIDRLLNTWTSSE